MTDIDRFADALRAADFQDLDSAEAGLDRTDAAAENRLRAPEKWSDPGRTATGERRATVPLRTAAGAGATTLWFNTGTLCNIACAHCYIESSPTNDRLVYLSRAEVERYLAEIRTLDWPTREIGFTGGEPYLNPEMNGMTAAALEAGFEVLVLTNAMTPMLRPLVREGLAALIEAHRERLTIRVSLDHYEAAKHDAERGDGAFDKSLEGLRWLRDQGARIAIAGRTMWDESEADARAGFAALCAREGLAIDCADPGRLVLFPEMDAAKDPPEITTACWGVLGKRPEQVMCASSRMVVKRKGADRPTVLSCTLIPYDAAFELGETLAEASRPVALKHPYCATFCVLGGASCSG
ncbi:MAG: radical SAM protein [Pseudomonadota bacterium]